MPSTLPFYTITLGFLLGVGVASFITVPIPVCLLILVLATGIIALWWRAGVARPLESCDPVPRLTLLFVGLGLAAFAFGLERFAIATLYLDDTSLASLIGHEITIEGRVIREPDVRETATLLTVGTGDTRVLVRADRYSDVSYGDTITATGVLKLPEAFETDLGRTFDYIGYLHARGVTHTMSFAAITIKQEDVTSLPARLYFYKEIFLARLASLLSPEAYGLGAGLLLGVQGGLAEETIDTFRTAGVVHIVVLSGYNIMLVVTFVLLITAFFLPFRARLIVSMIAIALFALLVGYGPSVLRASIMAGLLLCTMLFGRPHLILRMLVLAGVVMVAVNPYVLIYDIGFQLSCLATLGLILVAPQLELAFTRVTTWFSIRTFLVATLATQIAVAPLILYYIGSWSLVAVPANLLILPLVPLAMLLTFATGVIAFILPMLAVPVAFLAEIVLTFIIALARFMSTLPFAEVVVPPFSGYLVPLGYLLLGGLWYWVFYKRGQRHFGVSAKTDAVSKTAPDVSTWTVVEESSLIHHHLPETISSMKPEWHKPKVSTPRKVLTPDERDITAIFR